MTVLLRVKVLWSGWIGGPGVSVLHFSPGLANTTITEPQWSATRGDLEDGWGDAKAWMAPGTSLTIPKEADLIDSASGQIVEQLLSIDPVKIVTAAPEANTFDPSSMAVVRLKTDQYLNGRRLQGRMFFGPICSGALSQNGNLKTDATNAISTMFDAVTSDPGPRLAIYHRPLPGTTAGGAYGDVNSVSVWERPGVLRSRRD